MQLRDYTFLGTTNSLCPECLALVPAKIITKGKRVYFRKKCPTHGSRDDFICSDVAWYDRMEYSLPAKLPAKFGVEPDKGCPYDCGLCTEHEQHTCVALVEITGNCNLTCPMCFASSAPGGKHLSLEECKKSIDRLVEMEGQPEVMQLSGGEPTIHPQFEEVFKYAMSRPIDFVSINTNGVRLANDDRLLDLLAENKERLEIYFQLDGLSPETTKSLRGEDLLETKLRAIAKLGERGIHITLAATMQGGVNEHEPGPLVQFAVERPWITGISFQPATYSGRHTLPEELEQRITFPDVIQSIASQTDGLFREDDFMPLPCAHPNCHSLTFAYRHGGSVYPLMRFFDAKNNLDLLANGISFTRPRARNLVLQYLGRQGCCSDGGCAPEAEEGDLLQLNAMGEASANGTSTNGNAAPADEFFAKAIEEQLGASDLFRITITSFLDAYNFDTRRLMKCCTHHVLPSGHIIPFCAYNVLYREGHVALPALKEAVEITQTPDQVNSQ